MKIEKTPFILIPALAADKSFFKYQQDHLDDIADISVPVFTEIDNIPDMAAKILENAPEQFALGGVSMGGYVALEIMRQAPRRVTRLALINTTVGIDSPEALAKREAAINNTNEDNFLDVITNAAGMYFYNNNNKDGILTEQLVEMAKNIGLKGFINQQTAIKNRIDSTPFLKDITCKTMIVAGRNDFLLESMQKIQDFIPMAKFTIIEECGHMSPMEQPVALTSLLRYWLI